MAGISVHSDGRTRLAKIIVRNEDAVADCHDLARIALTVNGDGLDCGGLVDGDRLGVCRAFLRWRSAVEGIVDSRARGCAAKLYGQRIAVSARRNREFGYGDGRRIDGVRGRCHLALVALIVDGNGLERRGLADGNGGAIVFCTILCRRCAVGGVIDGCTLCGTADSAVLYSCIFSSGGREGRGGDAYNRSLTP